MQNITQPLITIFKCVHVFIYNNVLTCRLFNNVDDTITSNTSLPFTQHPVNTFNLIQKWYAISKLVDNTHNVSKGIRQVYNYYDMLTHICTLGAEGAQQQLMMKLAWSYMSSQFIVLIHFRSLAT